MWIARDKDGKLYIYNSKPVKDEFMWVIPDCTGGFMEIEEEFDEFPEVKWEDEEPRELILK